MLTELITSTQKTAFFALFMGQNRDKNKETARSDPGGFFYIGKIGVTRMI